MYYKVTRKEMKDDVRLKMALFFLSYSMWAERWQNQLRRLGQLWRSLKLWWWGQLWRPGQTWMISRQWWQYVKLFPAHLSVFLSAVLSLPRAPAPQGGGRDDEICDIAHFLLGHLQEVCSSGQQIQNKTKTQNKQKHTSRLPAGIYSCVLQVLWKNTKPQKYKHRPGSLQCL